MNKKTFKLATLGCRTNQYETQAYRKQLLEMGYAEAADGDEAELCIVNTCTVTENADHSSIAQIKSLIAKNPRSKVLVTGCLADAKSKQLTQIEGVYRVVSNKEKETLLSALFPQDELPEFSIKEFEAHTRAFVKVQDGCNSFCTYCIIPYVRGRSRSRPIKDVLREVEALVANGYKEVVITGINVGDYDGGDGSARLCDLIFEVDQVKGLERLRVSSIDPDEVDGALADAILEGKTTCPSMHIVLQSGSNVILKKMNRKYTRQCFLNTIDHLKEKRPNFTFTTDVIVGFPGETEEDFEQTLQVLEEIKFAKVHFFPYSKRQRTRAALYPNQISQKTTHARKQILSKQVEKNAFELREGFIGMTLKVLIESHEEAFGHSAEFLPVYLKDSCSANEIVSVKITGNTPKGLIGDLL